MAATQGLSQLARLARQAQDAKRPPLHLWNPDFCGDIDMRIARDGTWYYLGSPIGREAMVKLFATVLKREGEDFFLHGCGGLGAEVLDNQFLDVGETLLEILDG